MWGFSCGIAGSVYRTLAYEPFFSPWWQFGNRYEKRWFFKPVWACAHCTAGQLALWTYLIIKILPPTVHAIRLEGGFFLYRVHYFAAAFRGLFCLILAISVAIGTAKIFYKKIEE
jgi:hypothetical protein